MKSIVTLLIVAVVSGASATASAQDTGANALLADVQRKLAAQEQLVRDVLQRLEEQEAANATLLQRLAALEAARAVGQATAAPPDPASTAAPSQQPPTAVGAEITEEATTRLEERLDNLPKIVGYYDFEFFREGQPGTVAEFRQHHVFLDFSKEYEKFRVLAELEFEYAVLLAAPASGNDRGEVSVEQTWAEYVASDAMTLRAGFILTPNHWNVNHYPNITLSTRPPLIVRKVYPESFVGIMGYGTKYWGAFGLGYNAFVGNGEGASFGQHDDNKAKAVGGVLRFEFPTAGLFDSAKVAVNGYADTPRDARRTRTWGLESQTQRGRFAMLFEYARRRAVENRSGVYVQPSYQLSDRVSAFYRYDRLAVGEGATRSNTWGLNARPIPPVSLKFEFFRAGSVHSRGFNGIASSIAVVF